MPCLHGISITQHCPFCDRPFDFGDTEQGRRYKDACRFGVYVHFYCKRLMFVDLAITEKGKAVWQGSLDAWNRARLD